MAQELHAKQQTPHYYSFLVLTFLIVVCFGHDSPSDCQLLGEALPNCVLLHVCISPDLQMRYLLVPDALLMKFGMCVQASCCTPMASLTFFKSIFGNPKL